jgi:O-antigen/teichoic acid export membrane protein
VQLIVQAVGLASGILIVRTLNQREYAYFTIAFAMMGTMNVLADSGIGIGLSSIGGRVWQNPQRFGQLINTAMRLRRYLAAAAIVIVAPLLIWMLIANGASGAYAGVIALAVLLALNCQLSSGVLGIVPRLHSQLGRVQKLDFIGAVARLALLCAAYFVFLNAAIAAFATLFSVAIQYFLLRRWVTDSIDTHATVNEEDHSQMLGIVKSQAPNAVFYCVQGQLTIWLIGIFGSTKNIAEIGALGRLGIIFAVISSVMSSIVLPSFARCQSRTQLRRRYFQIVSCFIFFGAILLIAATIFPDEFLWVLGKQYSHLTNEVLLMALIAVLNSIGGAMLSLNATKGWVKYYWLNIPCLIILQALLIYSLNLTTTHGVLVFGILSLLPGILFSGAITWANLFHPASASGE